MCVPLFFGSSPKARSLQLAPPAVWRKPPASSRLSVAMHVPEDIIETISKARPTCKWFDMGKCKKGGKRSLLHRNSMESQCTLPFVSCTMKNGEPSLQVRPPLKMALCKYLGIRDPQKLPVQAAKQEGDKVIFQLQLMEERDAAACEAIINQGYCTMYNADGDEVAKPGPASKIEKPKFLVHGTGITEALSILDSRRLKPSKSGVVGEAVYGFGLDETGITIEGMLQAFAQVCRLGYNKGAAFILEADGILVRGRHDCVVPPGVIAFKVCNERDHSFTQFGVHPDSVTVRAVVFSMDALVGGLSRSMEVENYSVELHNALAMARDFFMGGAQVTNERLVALRNPCPSATEGGVEARVAAVEAAVAAAVADSSGFFMLESFIHCVARGQCL